MKRTFSRALSMLALACLPACASDDEPDTPLGPGVEAALDAATDEPSEARHAAHEGPVDTPSRDARAAVDAVVVAPSRDGTSPSDADAAPMDAARSGAPRDADVVRDAGLDAATPVADAKAEPHDAPPTGSKDAASDASHPNSMDATSMLDAAQRDAREAGAEDAATVDDTSVNDAAPGVERATFSRIYALLRQRCRGCHLPGATYSLDFSTRQIAYDELVGGPNMGAAEFIVCSGLGYRRVVPGDPDASLLVQKLEATQPCGDRMPPGALPDLGFSGEVRRWISAGALND